MIWGLYNAALAMVFGFGPAMLVERDWAATAASSATSIVLWLAAISVPLGGVLADRLQRNQMVLFAGLALFAIALAIVPQTSQVVPAFIALGIVGGIAAGPIMSLPSMVLQPGNRARGMGLFFTIYYVAIFVGPTVGGLAADSTGTADAAIYLGSAMLLTCMVLQVTFMQVQQRLAKSINPIAA
jgi:MFS family permease